MFDCIKSSLLEKPLELSEIRNIIPNDSNLFEQIDKIEDIDHIKHKLKPADMNKISFNRYIYMQ